jgi:hypothetical protein
VNAWAQVVEDSAVSPAAAPADSARAGAVSRRALLSASSAAVALLLTGCKGVQALGTPPPPAPDIVALRAAISAEVVMVARYSAALARLRLQMPGRGTPTDVAIFLSVRTLQAEHAAHLAQLKSRLIQPAGSAPSPGPTPKVQVTGTIAAELAVLEQAEQAASDRLLGQLIGLPPSLAQLFASIAASEATHVPYLQAAWRGR